MNCKKCGADNDNGAEVCKKCGESMEAEGDTTLKPAVKRGKKGLFIGITATVVAGIAIAAVLMFTLNVAPAFGNTPANIVNKGIAAENGDWIYYRNGADGGSLYKIRMDGTDKMKLNSEISIYINVAGGWVYYRNISEGDKFCICRVRTDGTGRETIYEDLNAGELFVYGDWIYFFALDSGKMYRMRLDGTEVAEYDRSLIIKTLTDVDGWSYVNSKDGLGKVRPDGTGWELLTGDKVNCLNAAGGWVYYSNASDGGSVYKIRTDGTERTKLNDRSSKFINIAGDWIYYGIEGSLYRMKTDGSENQPVN